jgi:cholesterol transport system auxiliary component
MKAIIVFALLAALAGCGGLKPTEAHRYFVLTTPAAPTQAAPATPSREAVLLIGHPQVATFYDTQSIAFSRTAGQLGYYQYSSWTEPPGRRLTTLLSEAIERKGDFRGVAVAGSGVRGQLLLSTRLEEIYHDASVSPGVARVALVAELIDLHDRRLLARRSFSATAPVATADAVGAAGACGRALATVLDEVAAWAGGVPTS